jgi:hypothetical protein
MSETRSTQSDVFKFINEKRLRKAKFRILGAAAIEQSLDWSTTTKPGFLNPISFCAFRKLRNDHCESSSSTRTAARPGVAGRKLQQKKG